MAREDVSNWFKVALIGEGAINNLSLILFPMQVAKLAEQAVEWLLPAPVVYLDMTGGVGWLRAFRVRCAVLQHFVVVGHGTPAGPLNANGQGVIPVETLAALLRRQALYRKKMPVLLLSCEVGAGSYPQQLANALGASVVATPDLANMFGYTVPRDGYISASWYRWTPDPLRGSIGGSLGPTSDIVGGSSVFVFKKKRPGNVTAKRRRP